MAQSISRIPKSATENQSQSEQGKLYKSLLIFERDFMSGLDNAAIRSKLNSENNCIILLEEICFKTLSKEKFIFHKRQIIYCSTRYF
jgi:hypothetical protein